MPAIEQLFSGDAGWIFSLVLVGIAVLVVCIVWLKFLNDRARHHMLREVRARCGHKTPLAGMLHWDDKDHPVALALHTTLDEEMDVALQGADEDFLKSVPLPPLTDYCIPCLQKMVRKCPWCRKSIIPNEAVTLRPTESVPEEIQGILLETCIGFVPHSVIMGCSRNDCVRVANRFPIAWWNAHGNITPHSPSSFCYRLDDLNRFQRYAFEFGFMFALPDADGCTAFDRMIRDVSDEPFVCDDCDC